MLIETILSEELFMGSHFFNMSLTQYNNLIRILDGAETMSNNERRTAFHQSFQRFLHDFFTFRIKSRCSFVQNQDFRIFQNSSGNGNSLTLTAG